MSRHFTLVLNYNYLSSKQITLLARGPSAVRSVNIGLKSKSTSFRDFLTCVIQLFGIGLLGVVAVFLARHCEMKKITYMPTSAKDGPETENLNEDEKSGDSHEEVSEEESSDDDDYERDKSYSSPARKKTAEQVPAVELNDALMA